MNNTGPYAKAQAMYESVPEYIKDDLFEALKWAKETLTDHEGSGHYFEIDFDTEKQGFQVCFAKPEWSADHVSQPMATAQQAIVMAVCEYLSGV